MAGTSPAMTLNGAARLLLKSFDEPLQEADPDLVFADLVLDAVLEVGIVIDLHHDEARGRLLDIDPVEALPDRAGGAHGDIDQLRGRLIDLEGAEPALVRGAVGAVFDHLP